MSQPPARPTEDPSDTAAGAHPEAPAPTPHDRRIRSFVLRAGRMGPGQQRALAELGPRFVLPFQAAPLDLDAVFGRPRSAGRRVLEIGFGMGDATAALAAQQPGWDVLGLEVHPPGVGALLKLVGEQGLSNVRIVQHDAVEVLAHMIPPGALDAVHIWFPDPWHKKRHHKRRLIQPAFVASLVPHLAIGGTLHLATDWQPYAEQMLEVLRGEPRLANAAPDAGSGYAPRPPWRARSRFETRGLKLGHGVWDLVFTRSS